MDKEPENAFDKMQPFDMEAAQKYMESQAEHGKSLAYLTHQVFAQTEAGQELLARWVEMVTMLPVASPGLDTVQIGVREGWNCFVRDILQSIRQVEAEEK